MAQVFILWMSQDVWSQANSRFFPREMPGHPRVDHPVTSLTDFTDQFHFVPGGGGGGEFTVSHHLAATHPSRAAARPLDTNGLFPTIPKLSSPMLGSLALKDLVLSGPHPLFLKVSSRRSAPRFWGLPFKTSLLLPCFQCTVSMTRPLPS